MPGGGRKPSRGDLNEPAVVDELCARIIAGEGIAGICTDQHMPRERGVYERMASDEEFRRRIAHAREAQQDALMDQTVAMADAATPADWQVVKLRIWARQWMASKLAPKKYGDAVQVRHANAEGGTLQLNDTAAANRMAAILAAARSRLAEGLPLEPEDPPLLIGSSAPSSAEGAG